MKVYRVIPFPLARRRQLIDKCVFRMLQLSQAAAERHLDDLLALQVKTLRRKGVAEPVISAEVNALASAIRAEVWRQVLHPRGTA